MRADRGRRRGAWGAGLAGLAAAVVLVACGGTSGSSQGTTGPPTVLPARLVDYDIQIPGPVKAGLVTFHMSNQGKVSHAMLVARTDLPPNKLPTTSAGLFDVSSPAVKVVADKPLILPGDVVDMTVELPAGRYVLVCNLADHFKRSMFTPLTVTS